MIDTHCIRGILFDLDGTLYHMKWFMKPALTLRLMPDPLILPRYMSIRKRHAGIDYGNARQLLEALAGDLAAAHKRRYSEEAMLDWIQRRFYAAFVKTMPLLRGSRQGLTEIVSALKDSDVRLGVLSDFDFVDQRLEGLRIPTELFDTRTSTESYGCLKPAPRSFLDIARAWDVSPESVLVIGDRTDTDGAAASACGMQFLCIKDGATKNPDAMSWKDASMVLRRIISS
jgi:HAD superfamily hydrolase (TIGR01549 family)